LRALAINTLITEAVDLFLENEEAILKGEFHESLFDKSSYEAQIKDIIKISVERIYQSEEVINKEIAGYKMLSHLLDTYTEAFLPESAALEDSNYNKLIRKSAPKLRIQDDQSVYKTLMQICSYTASLTDGITVASFEKYKGLKI
jgi:dGTPase